jgi:hypothetical protein
MLLFSCRKSLVSGLGGGAGRPAAGLLRYSTWILISLRLTASTFGSVTVNTPSR